MAENNSEEKKQVSTTGSDKTGKAVPTKRAVQMIDEMKSPTKPLPLAKKNWSWPSFIVVLGYIIGVAVGSMQKYSVGGDTGTRILFLIAIFFLGSLGGVLVYNLGKWIGARISGYQLSYICISGLCWDRSRADKRVYFDGSQFLELHSRFTPKDENIDRDPAVMLILGYVVWAILFVVVLSLGLTVVSTSNSGLKWGMVFGSALSASYVLYQICPFRQDYPSDMFAFISTREKENREAFNIYYYNRGREFSDVEMLVPNFSSFDSYWKAKTLIYV
ncbi:MAG TPA: hypothetical protein DEA32_02450, partial [Firmicutes bacterium]|nr:hypothetical protein [Bacillota bacterium]